VQADPAADRNVVPRWRPLAGMDRRDLASVGIFSSVPHPNSQNDLKYYLAIWRAEGNVPAASDLFDAYLLTNDRQSLRAAISILRQHKNEIPPRLRDSIEIALRKKINPIEIRRQIAFRETDDDYVRSTIGVFKSRLKEHPRDALLHLEVARLYAILGNFLRSEQHLFIARNLSPNSRVILRATVRFYDTVCAAEEALAIIRKCDILKFDPWIQSAEIATSTSLKKDSKILKLASIKYDKNGNITRDTTELAMAIATLDKMSGVKERKIFKLVGDALHNSTENGFSQAVWLSDNSSRDFLQRFPEAKPAPEALEAKVQLSIEQKNFEDAVGFAEMWAEEQPFNTRAIVEYLNLSSVHTTPTPNSVKLAIKASNVFADNWHVLNACLLVLSYAGLHNDANRIISRLEKIIPSDVNRSFLDAAKGFSAFSRGEFYLGRIHYEEAVKIAASARRLDLVINSTIFWLRWESQCCLVSEASRKRIIDLIERSMKKVDLSHRNYLNGVWYSSRIRIESHNYDCESFNDALEQIAEVALDQPDLFLKSD
jgi:hypothetical protein